MLRVSPQLSSAFYRTGALGSFHGDATPKMAIYPLAWLNEGPVESDDWSKKGLHIVGPFSLSF